MAFYNDIRNGILHQAQTKRNTQLTIHQDRMVYEIHDGISLDVVKFKDVLIQEYEFYVGLLRDESRVTIRNNFISKMNFITNNGVGNTGRQ